MTYIIAATCLLLQAGGGEPGTVKPADTDGDTRRRDSFRQEDLDALLRKVDVLEAELKELKKAPSKAEEKAPSQDPKPPGQNPPPKPPGDGKPTPQDPDEEKRKKMEEEFRKALGEEKPARPMDSPVTPGVPLGGGASLKLIDIAFDLLAVGGASTANEDELRLLQAGGHDPKNRGFTLQNAELTFSGIVDPYLRGDANIVLQIDNTGATTIELEEAYLTTLEFPFNLQLKAGQFFNAFGRINATHPHTWDFVDQPVIVGRVLGTDGYRAPGGQLSWLTPLPFFAELTGSVQNSQGDTAPYFRGVPGEDVAGRTLVARPVSNLGGMVYLVRFKTSFDPTDEITIVPGLSALFGPNATDQDNHTQVFGFDFYLKWKPLANDQGWPFVGWQTEAMLRRYGAAAAFNGVGVLIDRERNLNDWGAYSQVVWGFSRPWVAGFRLDYATGERDSFSDGSYNSLSDAFRDQRGRASVELTYYPSEFSKVRLQYNYDRSTFLSRAPFGDPRDAHGVYLQFEILFGAHGAHKF
ncbi:MAG TPA: hypothetical protein VKU80_09470 [Planctomycetota bacterium]|nr:hypothetical protein [Planctomycetota bacterium]